MTAIGDSGGSTERAILDRLADIGERHAVATERMGAMIERLDGHLTRADDDRDGAVDAIKEHVSQELRSELGRSETWWRRAFWIAVALLALSNLAGVALDKFVALLK